MYVFTNALDLIPPLSTLSFLTKQRQCLTNFQAVRPVKNYKMIKCYSFSYETYLGATERRRPMESLESWNYLPPDTCERTTPYPQPDRLVLDLPTVQGWKAELT